MYSVLGIDASFLDVEGIVSTSTSGPANTATSTSNSSTRTTIQASTPSRSNPTRMVALSLLTPSTPSTTIQASTPSRSNNIMPPPPLVTPSTSGLKGEREEAFDIFNFTLKPVWDCQTARNLFNMEEINDTVSLKLVEKMVKEFKTHRAALDFDTKYIKEEANL